MTKETSLPQGKVRAIIGRATEEFRHFVILFLYLWALFGLFVMNQAVLERQRGFDVVFHGFALVNALVLGKVMLVIEDLELARWLKAKPLVWVILFEALVCTILFACFHVIERLVVGMFHGASIQESIPVFGGGGLVGLVIVALIVFVSLLPFFAFKNVTRAIGSDRMKEILFRSRESF